MADRKKNQTPNWTVYLLARSDDNDLPSLNRGKLGAQLHHAGVQLATKFHDHPHFKSYIKAGLKEGVDHFNTTITLGATLPQIMNIVNIAGMLGFVSGTLLDPTYPYLVSKEAANALGAKFEVELPNNMVILTRPEITCGYLLGDRNDSIFRSLVANLNLLN